MLFYSVKPKPEVNYENPLGEAFIRLTPQHFKKRCYVVCRNGHIALEVHYFSLLPPLLLKYIAMRSKELKTV